MNKQKEKKVMIFEPDWSAHFMDIGASPLGKKLSRYGYTEDKHLEAMLHLFGFDLDYDWYEEALDPKAQRRALYTKDIYTGGSLFVGYKRSNFKESNLEKYCFGDSVDQMFDLIIGKGE
jgi:hypothetical protein